MHEKFCLRGGIKSERKIEETPGKDDRMAHDRNFNPGYRTGRRGDVRSDWTVVCFGSYIA